jgi:NAD(P)-dependent dehydrogenase (short-subunit alcohol dehydrogenase family)
MLALRHRNAWGSLVMNPSALIVGAGSGISASFARLLAGHGYRVALASRSLARHTPGLPDALRIACDAAQPDDVARLFARLDAELPPLAVVLYNPSYRSRGPLVDLAADDVQRALQVTAFGAFLVAQQAARRMLAQGSGAILFTGASASVKGYANSAPFAMGKFALRGLAQSMAREMAPQNLHVAHVVIDGAVRGAGHAPAAAPDGQLDPDAIAQAMWQLVQQPRNAWSWEIELRPWVEKF